MVLFKMRDSVPSASYSSVCNVLRQWSISLIPTYNMKCSANPRHNLTEMLHVLSEHTGMKLSCIKPMSWTIRG